MAKKAKRRIHQMPRLSPLDKLIYRIMMMLLIAVYFLSLFIPFHLRELISFRDDTVIAATAETVFLPNPTAEETLASDRAAREYVRAH